MAKEIINELLSVGLKVKTNEGIEATVYFKDFKNCKDVNISYNYHETYDGLNIFPPVLKEIKITIPCNGYSLEIIDPCK